MSDQHSRILAGMRRGLDQTQVREHSMPFATAHPSGVPTGYAQFRTDLGFVEYYDGAHWLTAHEYEVNLTTYGRTPQPIAANTNAILLQPRRTDYSADVTRIKLYCDVLTTNSAVSYWIITIGTDTTAIWAPTTAADGPGVAINKENAPNTIYTGNYWKVDVAKGGATGTPGNIVVNVSLWYRLVIP